MPDTKDSSKWSTTEYFLMGVLVAGLAIFAYNRVGVDAEVGVRVHLTETQTIELRYTKYAKPADSHPQLLTETGHEPSQQLQIGMSGKP